MLHDPGPETMAAAERAVEYARMVKADTIELNARLTRGNLLIEAGDPETGLAEMYEVRDRVVEQGLVTDLSRAHINLPSALEGVGRSAESVEVAMEGIAFCRKYGLMDTEGWVWANAAESLISLGRWDEAAEAVTQTHRCAQSAKPRGSAAQCSARVALHRGDHAAAARYLQNAHHHYGSHDPQPQYTLPLAGIALGIAAAEGRVLDGRAEVERGLASGLPFGTYKYGWPLLLAAATMEADARGLPTAEPGRPEAVARIRGVTRSLATPIPLWRAYDEWTRAELLRSEGRDGPADWAAVVAAVEPLDRPYDLARVRLRLAEALLAPDATDRDTAARLLRQARAVAERLGARPLTEAVTGLARRARLTLDPEEPARTPAAPVGPAEALGLTSRERDVLRLVAVGRSNRQIAEELFISPKTASVHVSNILAKLSVAGRGEAAALAHRLRLFPPGDDRLQAGR
ncbi:Helix-turn-helix transcriptional regulator OS=Streptomyces alboniger OX=132473 GN=CP975_25275 PE=4 SV=1 [Streptomyces alboniger]